MKVNKVHSFDLNRLSQAVASGQNNIRIQDFTNYDKLENVVIEQFEVGSELLSQLTKYFFIVPGSALVWAKSRSSPTPLILTPSSLSLALPASALSMVSKSTFLSSSSSNGGRALTSSRLRRSFCNNDKRNQVIETSVTVASNFEDF